MELLQFQYTSAEAIIQNETFTNTSGVKAWAAVLILIFSN
jgi:hypothetical protein